MVPSARVLVGVFVSISCLPLSSCGFGTATAVSSAQQDPGGDTPSQLLVSQVSVGSTRVSPARVAFTLTDPDASGTGRPADVGLRVQHAQFGSIPITAPWIFEDVGLTTPATLSGSPTSDQGVQREVWWDFGTQFANDPLLAGSGGLIAQYTEGFSLRASIAGSGDVDVVPFALGNDPPVVMTPSITNEDPVNGISGLVSVALQVADSGADTVDVLAEFSVTVGGGPPTDWAPATSQGAPLTSIETSAGGTSIDVQFFWDAITDLQNTRSLVVLRFTPTDGATEDGVALPPGESVQTASFLIDNNADPIVSIDQVSFQLIADQRRGIPIRFLVADLDGDPLRVLFQYRRNDEPDFLALPPLTGNQLIAAAQDPDFRRQFQIATDYQPETLGTLTPVGAGLESVRLAGLVDTRSSLPQREMVGRTLEILRSATDAVRLDGDWDTTTLAAPAACLPLDDGIQALVLESPSGTDWRLRRIDLATGTVIATIAAGTGIPRDVQAIVGDDENVLVLTGDGAIWDVVNVELATAATTSLASSAAVGEEGRARALASLGDGRAALAIGDGALLLALSATAPTGSRLVSGIGTASGIVRDPTRPGAVLLSGRTAPSPFGSATGRIVRVDLATRAVEDLRFVDESDPPATSAAPHPRGLAVDTESGRMLAVCDSVLGDATCQIRAFDLAGATSRILDASLPEEARTLAAGRSGLCVVPLPESDGIAAIGGLEQQRAITAYDAGTSTATVAAAGGIGAAFSPALDATRTRARTWRLRGTNPAMPASGSARPETFVWDSTDVSPNDSVAFRAIPIDAEVGPGGNSGGSIRRLDPFDVPPDSLGTDSVRAVGAADVDGDGRADLVEITDAISGFGESLAGAVRFLLQRADGSFGAAGMPDAFIGDTTTLRQPQALRIADLNGDGAPDLVVANGNPAVGAVAGNFVSIYLSNSTGLVGHAAGPDLRLGATTNTNDPSDVVVADLNGDGLLDVATANRAGNDVSVFLQTAPLVFGNGANPAVPTFKLGGAATTPFPLAIVAGDFDGNDTVDLAVASSTAGAVVVFPQSVAVPGAFGAPTSIPVGSFPIDVDAADIDGDGFLDLLVAQQFPPTGDGGTTGIRLLLQRGALAFDTQTEISHCIPDSDVSLGVSSGDLDGDGLADVVLRRKLGISMFRQLRAASGETLIFEEACQSTADAFAGSVARHEVLVRDLDGDGDADMLAGTSAGLLLYTPRGGGDYSAAPDVTVEGPFSLGTQPAGTAGDLDGDGDLDLVFASTAPTSLIGFVQTVPGQFSASVQLLVGGGAPSHVTMADFDGDRDSDRLQDIVVAQPGNALVRILLHVSPGVFGLPGGGGSDTILVTIPGAASAHYALAVGDLVDAAGPEDDGLIDLVVTSRDSDRAFVFRQTDPLVFEAEPSITLGGAGGLDGPLQVAIADLVDGPGSADDGLLDLAIVTETPDAVLIFAQSAPGQFGAVADATLASSASGSGPSDLVCVDIDRDGRTDVLCASPAAAGAELWLQHDTGAFGGIGGAPDAVLGEPAITTGASAVDVVDTDADGDLDVVVSAATEAGFVVFRQTTPGRFRPGTRPQRALSGTGGFAPLGLLCADIDGDGDGDVVRALGSVDELLIWFGGR